LITQLKANQKSADDHVLDLKKAAESGAWKFQIATTEKKKDDGDGGDGGSGGDRPSGAGVPKFALGGVVDYPTLAYLAERGPELVVPLNKSDRMQGGKVGVNYNLTINSSSRTENVVADFQMLQAMASVMR
jgi:hypothetical protein